MIGLLKQWAILVNEYQYQIGEWHLRGVAALA